MKNFVKVASLVATLALAAQVNAADLKPLADKVNSKHVENVEGQVWTSGDYGATNGTDKLCWQTGYYPDGNAIVGCDAVAKPAEPKPDTRPTPVGAARLNFDAATLFAFDKANISPMGQQMLGRLASVLNSTTSYDQAVVTGHTDSWGSDAYNDRLSLRRAEAVKSALVSQGVASGKVVTAGRGERDLIVTPASCKGTKAARQACEQPNRRVTVDVVNAVVPANKVNEFKSALEAVGVNTNK